MAFYSIYKSSKHKYKSSKKKFYRNPLRDNAWLVVGCC